MMQKVKKSTSRCGTGLVSGDGEALSDYTLRTTADFVA